MSTPEPLREIGQIAEGAVELYTIKWSDSTEGIKVSNRDVSIRTPGLGDSS